MQLAWSGLVVSVSQFNQSWWTGQSVEMGEEKSLITGGAPTGARKQSNLQTETDSHSLSTLKLSPSSQPISPHDNFPNPATGERAN
jgi:hypothetical protein